MFFTDFLCLNTNYNNISSVSTLKRMLAANGRNIKSEELIQWGREK